MAQKKNGQIHLKVESELLEQIKKEAKELDLPIAELIRIRLKGAPLSQEIILFRKIKEVIEKGGIL